MPSYNHVTIIGHLGRDPELRYLPSNTAVVSFSLAVNESWKDKQTGEKQERVNWIDVEAFGKAGEVINQYVGQGDPLLVAGKLRQDKWQDRDGNNRSKLKVVCEQFQFLGKSEKSAQAGHRRDDMDQRRPDEDNVSQLDHDDIPFSPDGFDGPAWRG